MKKYKSISSTAPQGESLDDFLKNKNLDFLDYLASNVKKNIIKEEVNNFKFDDGGEPRVILDNPANPLQPRKPDYNNVKVDPTNNFYTPGPFGPYASNSQQVPSYVNSFQQANPYTPYPQQQFVNQPQDNFRRNNNIADISMAAVQTVNSFFDRYYANQQNKKNQQMMGIENTAQTQYGNRGDYDVNSGIFRPDQYTVPGFKKGGEPKKGSAPSANNVPYDRSPYKFKNAGDSLNYAMGYKQGITNPMGYIVPPDEQSAELLNQYNYGFLMGETDIQNYNKVNKPQLTNAQVRELADQYKLSGIRGVFEDNPAPILSNLNKYDKERVIKASKYKKGGQYSVDDKTIAELLSQGYEFEILD